MTSQEIASLSARVSITGLETATAKLRGFDAALGRSASSTAASTARMNSAAVKTTAAYEAMRAQQVRSLRALRTAAIVGTSAVGAASAAALAYGVKLNAQWESNQASFATFLGSVQKARKFTEQLRSVSAKSPLRLTEYAEGAKKLLGFGVEAKKVIPLLDAVNKAIVATGKGSVEMNRVVIALGQMQSKGKLMAGEMLQLAEVGVPVNKILQKELGLTAEQIGDIGTQGVTAEKGLAAIARGWNKQFGPAYANAQQTFAFQSAAAKKSLEQLLRVATAPVFEILVNDVLPAVNSEVAKLISVIDNPKLSGGEKWKAIEGWFSDTLDKMGALANDAVPKVAAALTRILPVVSRALERITPVVAETLARLAVAAVPLAVLAGANIAKGLVKGFAESDWLGKLLIGAWLFKAFGGFAAISKAGFGIGTIISGGMAKGLAAGQSAAWLAGSFGRGAIASTAAGMGAAGMSLASSLFRSFARAIPILGVAFGLTEIVSSAISGDMKSAGIQAGGMMAGALIGTAIAPGVGTMIGAGIGAIAAPIGAKLIEGIVGGANNAMPTLREQITAGATQVAQAVSRDSAVLETLRSASDNVSAAQQKQRASTAALRQAEANLAAARATYGPQSWQAVRAEMALAQAKDKQAAATRRAQQAERLQGVARQAASAQLRNSVGAQKQQIYLLQDERKKAIDSFVALRKRGASLGEQAAAAKRFNQANKAVKDGQQQLNKTLARAADEIGPRFAKRLAELTPQQIKYGRGWINLRELVGNNSRQVTQSVKNMTDSQVREWAKAKKMPGAYTLAIGELRERVGRAMRSLPEPVRSGLGSVNRQFRNSASAISSFSPGSFGVTLERRKGGSIGIRDEGTSRTNGNLIPVMVAPGEMIAIGNRSMIVPGTNDRRDSVGMMLPVGAEVFTYSGQSMLAKGYSRDYALRNQAPHFATGGLVKPRMTGGTPKGRNVGDLAFDRTRDMAWSRLKAIHAAAKKLWSGGAGTQRSYPGLSGDTDFVPALGWMLSALARATVGSISVTSGYRSVAEQAALFAKNPNPKMVAPPGKSNHGRGIAADISPQRPAYGGKQSRFGLTFPMSWEPWHIELAGNPRFPSLGQFITPMRKGGKLAPWMRKYKRWGPNMLTTLAHYVGMKNPSLMGQIAMGESSGNPLAIGDDAAAGYGNTFGYGLWQITSGYNDDLIAKYGGASASGIMDPVKNALAAKEILDRQGTGAWYAPPTGPAGKIDPVFLNKLRYSPKERGRAKAAARKQRGRVARLIGMARSGTATSAARTRLRLAAKWARIAAKRAKKLDVKGARVALAKSREFGSKARSGINVPKVSPGNASTPPRASRNYDPSKPISPTNFPGVGALPDEFQNLLDSPGLSGDAREGVIQQAIDAAATTPDPTDDAAAYGALLRFNQRALGRARGRVSRLNRLIAKKGGTKRLGKLGKRLSNIDKQIAAAKKSGDKDALKVLRKRREAIAKQMAEIRRLISRRNDAISDMGAARQGIATAREGLGDITGTGETSDLASEMKALREAIEEQNRIQAATQSVAGGEIGQAVRDWLSGELVGKTNGYSQSSASVRY